MIRGSAVNQDGASNGLTAPNGPAQERVIRQALANAGLAPAEVDAVEAHGTGTTLGDPIEAGALLATYGQGREEPLYLGSIKSNIGHTQAAAGVAGVIKMVEAMREGVLPKTLHVDRPSSKVDWEQGKIELLAEEREWEADGHPRRAAVSSFGISGTNAHLILEQAPEPEPAEEPEPSQEPPSPLLFPLSAKAEPALAEAAARLAAHLREHPELGELDVAHTLASARAALPQRAVAVASDREQLLDALAVLAEGEGSARAIRGEAGEGKLAYLLSGQGSQRPGMGKELYERCPAYREALEEALAAIDPHLGRPLADLLFSEPGSSQAELLENTAYAQPALFATELALHRQLQSQGLRADLLAGHSVGEIAAAHLAGVFSLAEAAELVCARGALMAELPEGGAMVAIEAPEAEVAKALAGREQELSIAAVNGPAAVVVSGAEGPALEVAEGFAAAGAKTKRLAVSHAFHSPLIEPMLEPFAAVLAGLSPAPPKLPLVSALDGELLSAEAAADPERWVAHVRAPVRFGAAIAALAAEGAATFLELGPGAVLLGAAAAVLEAEGKKATLIPALREGRAEPEALAAALAAAHAHGAPLEWGRYFAGTGARQVPLPTYPFQRRRYWLQAAAAGGDPASVGLARLDHPLLGAKLEDPAGEGFSLSGRISLQTHPWLRDHAVAGTVLLPGTAFLELALLAAREAGEAGVAELTLQAPLVLPEQGALALRVAVSAPGERGGGRSIHYPRPETEEADQWLAPCPGAARRQRAAVPPRVEAWPPTGAAPIEIADLYELLEDAGLSYGPAFQEPAPAWRAGDDLYVEVAALPEELAAKRQCLRDSPGIARQRPARRPGGDRGSERRPDLPFAWRGVRLSAARRRRAAGADLSAGAGVPKTASASRHRRRERIPARGGGVARPPPAFARTRCRGALAALDRECLLEVSWQRAARGSAPGIGAAEAAPSCGGCRRPARRAVPKPHAGAPAKRSRRCRRGSGTTEQTTRASRSSPPAASPRLARYPIRRRQRSADWCARRRGSTRAASA